MYRLGDSNPLRSRPSFTLLLALPMLLILFNRCDKRESIPLLFKLNVWGRTITLGELPRSDTFLRVSMFDFQASVLVSSKRESTPLLLLLIVCANFYCLTLCVNSRGRTPVVDLHVFFVSPTISDTAYISTNNPFLRLFVISP